MLADQYQAIASSSSPIYPGGGATPGPAPGLAMSGTGYSPTITSSPAYRGIAGTTPAYTSSSPRYQGPPGAGGIGAYASAAGGAAYAPYNQLPYNLPATGGTTPAYQPGIPSGMSPSYRPTMGQSPVYTPGNPSYSPTQPHYGGADPAYPPGGPGGAGAPGQQDGRN